MVSPASGRARSARTDLTRAGILSAARDEFVTRGYRATSLRDIAASAGMSHAGLLRHFATKDELLAEVVASLEEDNQLSVVDRVEADGPGKLQFSEIARGNEKIPGYLALFAALMGEGSTASHPAHEHMRERYSRLIDISADAIEDAREHGTIAADRDPHTEAIRIAAAWDGLQLLDQYLGDRIDIGSLLERHEELLALPIGWHDADDPAPTLTPAPVPPKPQPREADDARIGYRAGRVRRARILTEAISLFAREGYGDTSLHDIAARVGVSKSLVLHYYGSKEDLLSAVLHERDKLIASNPSYQSASRAAEDLRTLPQGARDNRAHSPGLIQVHAVLSCEALPADHPAHAYFERRFGIVVDHFSTLLRVAQADGDLPTHRDPDFEAVWLVALWEGLQYQWLYDPDSVDVASELEAHLDDILPRR